LSGKTFKTWLSPFLVFCLTCYSASVFANPSDLIQIADQRQLATSNEWLNLLHFKNGRSEIDDPAFFFAKNGKTNSQAELHASLTALLNDQTDDEQSVYCKYHSRSSWLVSQLPEIEQQIRLPSCQALQQEITHLDADSITLILASAHINSPASAFGHTFLRIDSRQQTPLTAYAVNYAAQTQETNGLIYAYRGIFGGYEGRYSILPYAKKVQEYSDLEQRDIWEYRLNLTADELARLNRHIFEIRHFYADYFFFDENCSYNLLWLLQIARPGTDLTSQFNLNAIPIDTVRAIEQAGFIADEVYRPSNRKRMLKLAENLQHDNAWAFIKNGRYDLASLQDTPLIEQTSALEISATQLKHQRSQGKIEQAEYSKTLLSLLRARSQLGNPLYVDIPPPASPKNGHLSSRLNLGWRHNNTTNKNDQMLIGFKPAYHAIDDHDYGYLAGAYISFFDVQLASNEDKTEIDSLMLVDIRSYAIQDSLHKPISWQVQLGAKRLQDDALYSFIKTGAGLTLGSEKHYGFVLLAPAAFYRDEWHYSAAVEAGVMSHYQQLKLGIQLTSTWFDQTLATEKQANVFATYQFNQKWAVNLNHEARQILNESPRHTSNLNVYYYF